MIDRNLRLNVRLHRVSKVTLYVPRERMVNFIDFFSILGSDRRVRKHLQRTSGDSIIDQALYELHLILDLHVHIIIIALILTLVLLAKLDGLVNHLEHRAHHRGVFVVGCYLLRWRNRWKIARMSVHLSPPAFLPHSLRFMNCKIVVLSLSIWIINLWYSFANLNLFLFRLIYCI